MRALKTIAKVITAFIGTALLLAGVYLAIAGAISGFGTPTLAARIGFCVLGIIFALLGYYSLYYASDKNLVKIIDNIINDFF